MSGEAARDLAVGARAGRTGVVPAVIARWVLGAVIASVLVGLISPYFLSSLRVYEWSAELDEYIFKDGFVYRKRDEGWASTHYGRYGFNRMDNVADASVPTVMIWGDSYVEAHQVPDEQKAVCQVNRALAEQGSSPVRAVAVARARWSVSDYYFKIPAYERLLTPMCHFIVLAEYGVKDLCPDGETFFSEPQPRFVQRSLVDSSKSRIITDLYERGLSDLLLAPWEAVHAVMTEARDLRFSLGPAQTVPEIACGCAGCVPLLAGEPDSVIRSWSYAIDMLKASTSKPIVFVLVPDVPRLERGTVCCVDSQAEWRARLARLCEVKQVGCIDMTEALIRDYRTTGRLSRGFHNGRPGSGHLNARGNRLLARSICDYLSQHRDCLEKADHAVQSD